MAPSKQQLSYVTENQEFYIELKQRLPVAAVSDRRRELLTCDADEELAAFELDAI